VRRKRPEEVAVFGGRAQEKKNSSLMNKVVLWAILF
jgi:hypothetical protein